MTQVLEREQGSPSAPVGLVTVLVACIALAALSLLLPSSITFDPFTWATWGREIVHNNLVTDAGPAWKPLPVLVDVLLAPFGGAEEWLWLVVARAGGLLGAVMAYRLAQRLAGPPGRWSGWWSGRWAGVMAGLMAAAGLLLSSSFLEYLTPFGMSEPLLAGLALLATERHLDGHFGQAFGLVFACLLLRPEALPFFVGYAVFLWWRAPRARPWVILLAILLPVLWLLPDFLSSGDWLRSTRRASMPTQGGPLLSAVPALAVLASAFNAIVLPVVVGAAAAMVMAVTGYVKRREDGPLLALSAICLGWLAEVAVTTQARMGSGDQRYLIVTTAVGCVLAGVGWTRMVGLASAWLLRARHRMTPGRARVAAALAAVVVAAPFVGQRLGELSGTIGEVPYQAHKYRELAVLIQRAGGRGRILSCGPVTSDIYQLPALAWQLGLHQSDIVIAAGPKGTPETGRIVAVPVIGTVFRTRTVRGSPLLPARLGSPDFHMLAVTDQWQVLSTCGRPAA